MYLDRQHGMNWRAESLRSRKMRTQAFCIGSMHSINKNANAYKNIKLIAEIRPGTLSEVTGTESFIIFDGQITDTEKQWRILCQKNVNEINVKPLIINLRNGLYNVMMVPPKAKISV